MVSLVPVLFLVVFVFFQLVEAGFVLVLLVVILVFVFIIVVIVGDDVELDGAKISPSSNSYSSTSRSGASQLGQVAISRTLHQTFLRRYLRSLRRGPRRTCVIPRVPLAFASDLGL
jgi:hypothetical protein